jgi:excisionase family DNA binding protein
MSDSMLTVKELAAYLAVPTGTIYMWNSRGVGPRRYRLGKHVRYRRVDVDSWVDKRVAHTGFQPA